MDSKSSRAVPAGQMSELEAAVQRLRTVLAVSHELTSTLTLEPLLHKIVRVAAELTESEAASILLLDARTGELRFRAATGDASQQLSDIPVPLEGSIAGRVVTTGTPVVVTNAEEEPTHYKQVAEQTGVVTNSLLAVPMHIKERPIGVLEVINKKGGAQFTHDDIEMLGALADQAAVAIENASLVTALQEAYTQISKLD